MELAAGGAYPQEGGTGAGRVTPLLVVLEDAYLDLARDAAIFGKFLHQGQVSPA